MKIIYCIQKIILILKNIIYLNHSIFIIYKIVSYLYIKENVKIYLIGDYNSIIIFILSI